MCEMKLIPKNKFKVALKMNDTSFADVKQSVNSFNLADQPAKAAGYIKESLVLEQSQKVVSGQLKDIADKNLERMSSEIKCKTNARSVSPY